ncbi:MAG: response regulator [Candidatus Omnitrophota bacterium]|nr:response regulator [Candidatus Omnitrophota bacterium]
MGAKKILFVDDEAGIRAVIGRRLMAWNFDVLVVENANEALAKVEGFAPDFIALDHEMPGMKGMELCSLMKANSSLVDVPIVIFTCRSKLDYEFERDCIDAGAMAVVNKSDFGELLLILKKVFAQKK